MRMIDQTALDDADERQISTRRQSGHARLSGGIAVQSPIQKVLI